MEFMTAGGAVGDFDRDGDQDLFVIGGSAGVKGIFLRAGRPRGSLGRIGVLVRRLGIMTMMGIWIFM